MSKKWINSNGNFVYDDIPVVSDTLPVGVYDLKENKFGFFLEKVSDSFELPERIYESERDLINRVKSSFEKLDKNFGLLLKGLKGTGKTITAKQISNELQLPVILINTYYDSMGSYINSIQQDVIVLFDEFEKVYEFNSYAEDSDDSDVSESGKPHKRSISNLLTLMDGVFTSTYKRLFILTTNKSYLPDAILARPSRVRYVKDFNDLSYDGIMEILNDIVGNKELIQPLLTVMKDLEIITVDIVKSIAEEANMYNTAEPSFFSIFNLKRLDARNDVFLVDSKGRETKVHDAWKYNPSHLYPGQHIGFDGFSVKIQAIDISKSTFTAKDIDNQTGKVSNDIKTYVFRKAEQVHKNLELAF